MLSVSLWQSGQNSDSELKYFFAIGYGLFDRWHRLCERPCFRRKYVLALRRVVGFARSRRSAEKREFGGSGELPVNARFVNSVRMDVLGPR